MAAACSSGARSASARSIQWAPSPRCAVGRAVRVIALAVMRAASQSRHAGTGDHRKGRTPGGGLARPDGSNNQHWPTWSRAANVAAMTSGLVEVETTGPGATSAFGITRVVVLPDRGGPRTSMPCCGAANAGPIALDPRYSGDPAAATRARRVARSSVLTATRRLPDREQAEDRGEAAAPGYRPPARTSRPR